MHTCDGCYYMNRDGTCSREYYPELEEEERLERVKAAMERRRLREKAAAEMRRFFSRLLPWNWFRKEKP